MTYGEANTAEQISTVVPDHEIDTLEREWLNLPQDDFRGCLARIATQGKEALNENVFKIVQSIYLHNVRVPPPGTDATNREMRKRSYESSPTGVRIVLTERPLEFDDAVVQFILDHRQVFEKETPRLLSVADMVEKTQAKRVLAQRLMGDTSLKGIQLGALHQISIQDLEDTTDLQTWLDIIEDTEGYIVRSLVEFYNREVELEDITNIFPDNIRNNVREDLSYQDQVRLLGITNAMSRSVRSDNGRSMGQELELGRNTYNVNVTQPISQFVLAHPDAINDEFLARVVNSYEVQIPENFRLSILLSCMNEQDRMTYLIKNNLQPVFVMESYRNYESCYATEARLQKELESDTALILRLDIPDPTDASNTNSTLFAVKFEEITIVCCIETQDPRFQEKMSYIVFGQTFADLMEIRYNEGLKYDHVKIPERMEPIILGKNRKLTFEDEEWEKIKHHTYALEQKHISTTYNVRA